MVKAATGATNFWGSRKRFGGRLKRGRCQPRHIGGGNGGQKGGGVPRGAASAVGSPLALARVTHARVHDGCGRAVILVSNKVGWRMGEG